MKFEIRSRASNQGKGFVCLEITVQDMAKSSSKIPFYLEDWIIFVIFLPLAPITCYALPVLYPVPNVIAFLFIFMGSVIIAFAFAHFLNMILIMPSTHRLEDIMASSSPRFISFISTEFTPSVESILVPRMFRKIFGAFLESTLLTRLEKRY